MSSISKAVALFLVSSLIFGCSSVEAPPTGTVAATAPVTNPQNLVTKNLSNKEENYPVYFGTTRRFGEDGKFTNDRSKIIQYGVANVHVPIHRKRGSEGTLFGDILGYNKRVKISGDYILYNNYSDFHQVVAGSLSKEKRNNYVVIFIHGYNNSFDDALIRAAQMGADTQVPKHHMFMFSWPAVKDFKTYTQDEASVDVNEKYFSDFISKVAESVGNKKIHIVAHSMGNRALLRVIDRGVLQAKNKNLKFGQIILAAADVDAELFSQSADSYINSSDKTTVYLSPYDKAVGLSQLIHKYPRLGCGISPHNPNPKIDYVVSTIPSEFPAHGYITQHEPILNDLQSMFFTGKPDRSAVSGEWEKKAENFWIVGAAPDENEAKCADLDY